VPEGEFAHRVEINEDVCIVDGATFFVRGHLEIPIDDVPEPFAFSVWASLSDDSFAHMSERWEAPDRASDPPYFGWLSSPIHAYPNTINLKVSVQSRDPGLVPLFTVEPTGHPLALHQHYGISIEQWHELAHKLLHT
jgi:hypothetical protein